MGYLFIRDENTKDGLGNLTQNCLFYNHNQQILGDCYSQAIAASTTIVKNPEIINTIRDGKIEPISTDEIEIKKVEKTAKPNLFEVAQMPEL